ncbi:MAG: squalene/phytoene synthase family protein [Candidatus Competibacteraceae bacterium]|nr:squalene/phytoene synthase family protein [Candidatus Competibacteraceae bacterium]
MNPQEYCRQLGAPPGSDQAYSLMSQPPEKRRALTALYALDRELAQVVDQCQEPQVARAKFQWWRQELEALFEGRPSHPVSQALAPPMEIHDLPRELLEELVDGAEMDLDRDTWPHFKELSLYCHRRGSSLALLAAEILGYRQRGTRRFAHELGTARQLTALLAGIRHHVRQGRLPIPADEMARCHVEPANLLAPRSSDRVRELFALQAHRIRTYQDRAETLLPGEDRPTQAPLLVLQALERAWLEEIEAEGFPLLEQRTELTPLRRWWIAWRVGRRARRAV